MINLVDSQMPKLGNVTVVRPIDPRASSVSSIGEEQQETFDALRQGTPMDPVMMEQKRQSDLTLRLKKKSEIYS